MMRKTNSLLLAVVLILLGLWFLAQNMGIALPGLEQLWPIFVVLGGLSALTAYFSGRDTDPGQLFVGIAALGMGLFFFLFTLHVRLPVLGRVAWSDMSWMWPTFLLIAGVAFGGQFVLSGFKNPGVLVPGVLSLGVGLVSFAFTLELLNRALAFRLLKFWPVILIILGLGALVQTLSRR